jgi:hypothetical protein
MIQKIHPIPPDFFRATQVFRGILMAPPQTGHSASFPDISFSISSRWLQCGQFIGSFSF